MATPIIRVTRPQLTQQEREARMERLRQAVAAICIAQEKARQTAQNREGE